MPQVNPDPALIDFQAAVPTFTGAFASTEVPMPSWPVLFRPQHHKVLSLRIPHDD